MAELAFAITALFLIFLHLIFTTFWGDNQESPLTASSIGLHSKSAAAETLNGCSVMAINVFMGIFFIFFLEF